MKVKGVLDFCNSLKRGRQVAGDTVSKERKVAALEVFVKRVF